MPRKQIKKKTSDADFEAAAKKTIQKQKSKGYALKAKYGITYEEYEALMKAQGGRCAICDTYPVAKSLCVDHIHAKDAKGKQIVGDKNSVRGLLCFFCNKYVVGGIEHRNKVKPRDVLNGLIRYFQKYKMKSE